MFVMHPSWVWGTKAFDARIVVDNFETAEMNEANLQAWGMDAIRIYFLTQVETNGRIICSMSSVGPTVYAQLNATTEYIYEMNGSVKMLLSYDNFCEYIDQTDVVGFLIANDDETVFMEYGMQYVEQYGYKEKVEDVSYTLYMLVAN
jgi:hypothetical protein